MVDFTVQHTTTANITEANAEEEDIIVPSGVMHSGVVYFPAGCWGLAHCTINHAVHQVWPSDPSKNYAGEFFPIEIPDKYYIQSPHTKITMKYWNEDTRNTHEVTVKFTVSPLEEIFPEKETRDMWVKFMEAIMGEE